MDEIVCGVAYGDEINETAGRAMENALACAHWDGVLPPDRWRFEHRWDDVFGAQKLAVRAVGF